MLVVMQSTFLPTAVRELGLLVALVVSRFGGWMEREILDVRQAKDYW
jgi:hypothetical protein